MDNEAIADTLATHDALVSYILSPLHFSLTSSKQNIILAKFGSDVFLCFKNLLTPKHQSPTRKIFVTQ